MVQIVVNYLASADKLAKFAGDQYKQKYDEKRLCSEFELKNTLEIQQSAIRLLALTLDSICQGEQRVDGSKKIVGAFADLFKTFEECQQNNPDQYNAFFTERFKRVQKVPKNQRCDQKKHIKK